TLDASLGVSFSTTAISVQSEMNFLRIVIMVKPIPSFAEHDLAQQRLGQAPTDYVSGRTKSGASSSRSIGSLNTSAIASAVDRSKGASSRARASPSAAAIFRRSKSSASFAVMPVSPRVAPQAADRLAAVDAGGAA